MGELLVHVRLPELAAQAGRLQQNTPILKQIKFEEEEQVEFDLTFVARLLPLCGSGTRETRSV